VFVSLLPALIVKRDFIAAEDLPNRSWDLVAELLEDVIQKYDVWLDLESCRSVLSRLMINFVACLLWLIYVPADR
jgi:hypothetical protein